MRRLEIDLALILCHLERSLLHRTLIMKRIAELALLFLLSQPMFAALTRVPEIGEKLRRKDIPKSASHNMCVTHAAQADPCFDTLIGGIEYTIAFGDKGHRVTYISTSDPKFKTADGHKVGDEIEFPRSQLHGSSYWEIYGPTTQDGWRPIVGFDLGPLEPTEKNGTKIDLRGNAGKGDPVKTTIGSFSKGK
jgi:hypothetical protein